MVSVAGDYLTTSGTLFVFVSHLATSMNVLALVAILSPRLSLIYLSRRYPATGEDKKVAKRLCK